MVIPGDRRYKCVRFRLLCTSLAIYFHRGNTEMRKYSLVFVHIRDVCSLSRFIQNVNFQSEPSKLIEEDNQHALRMEVSIVVQYNGSLDHLSTLLAQVPLLYMGKYKFLKILSCYLSYILCRCTTPLLLSYIFCRGATASPQLLSN